MKTEDLNSMQQEMLAKLAKEYPPEEYSRYLAYLENVRSPNGAVASKDTSDRVSIKIYVHKDHRNLLNEYCNLTGTNVSRLIRELTLDYIAKDLESYL